jgi:DNA-binding LacI/PurR family transcriptional regulator
VDVAAAAGVSRTQASDALNGRGRVDAGTRERVVAAAAELGYRANLSARNLRSGKTGVLAMLLPAMGGTAGENEAWGLETYIRTTIAAASAAFAHGYALMFVPPEAAPSWLAQVPYDGVIVSDPDSDDQRLGQLEQLNVPFVTLERDIARERKLYVGSDTDRNTRMLLDHLAAAGAERIALLRPEGQWSWTVETTVAFENWSAERGRRPTVVPVSLHHLEGSAYETCLELFSSSERPDAVLGLAERFALGALRAAKELGLAVPDQLMIGSGIDTSTNAAVQPSITALEINPERSARAAVEMLVAHLAGEDPPAPLIVAGDLVVRESTSRAA